MGFVSDDFHHKRLEENKINIKTKYIVGNKILERNSDNSHSDDINLGIRCAKEYYADGVLKLKEKEFDSRIEYSFVANEEINKEHKCPNCGMEGKVKDFLDGCPYCGTNYNIEYSDKDLGSKYHYDRVLKSNLYRIIVGIIDLIISFIACFIFIKTTSRTFNSYDISKIFIYGLILAAILYFFFYYVDAYVVLGPIKRYKDKQNQKQIKFWQDSGLDKKEFFNNLNYEIGKYFYTQDSVIDYDVLDYLNFISFKHKDRYHIRVEIEARVVYYKNGNFSSKVIKKEFDLAENVNGVIEVKGGVNYIKCHNCGASIDLNSSKCEYCGSPIKYLQKWILDK